MGRLDNVRRIVKEDYDTKYHDLISRLSYVLNTFMEQVVLEFNGSVDFSNLKQDIISFKVKVDSSGTPLINELVRTTVLGPRGFEVIRAVDDDDPSKFVTTHPFITFTLTTDLQITKITNITGLTANTNYDFTVIAVG